MVFDSWGMMAAGVVALVAGLLLVRGRWAAADGVGKALVLGPVFAAVALAVFAAEHFLMARELAGIVPKWMPGGAMFWTYFVGVALAAAAVSFIAWRYVRWSAALLAVLFLIIVATVDLPGVHKHLHERLFWTLTVREVAFAGGAMVLAGSQWRRGRVWMTVGRTAVAGIFVFYAVEHFMFPRFVPGVPLEKLTPAWMPGAVAISYIVGMTELAAAVGLTMPRTRRVAAAGAGIVLVLLTVFFYGPILWTELGSAAAVEGVNYVGDTLLFAATALLVGWTQRDADVG